MARVKLVARRSWRLRRRRVLVASLLLQNPTAVERNKTAAEPAPGVTTRARRRRIVSAALPEEILVCEILVRLPAKDILRCRAVCRSWRGLTSAPDFLLAHHRRQPSLPLLTLYGEDSTARGSPIFKHSRPVLGFTDYEGSEVLLASCDGLLLLALSDGQFSICNPTTRECAPLPCLAAAWPINIAALYLHSPSGEYRVLYWKGTHRDHLKGAYYVLMVRRGESPRCIGVPSDIPGIEKVMSACHEKNATNPPVVFRNCLHWGSDWGGSNAGILVFDTLVESFRLVCRPAAATRFCNHLCGMEGSIGFSCNDNGLRTAVNIWVLEDYEREVWSFKYHVKFPVKSPCYFANRQHLVLSHKGDVLVYRTSGGYMFHYDNTGKLLEEFQCYSQGLNIIGHWFKESLVKHDISLMRGCAPFFQRV